jgi:LPXTG-site transpeptidase (sortase) family protein
MSERNDQQSRSTARGSRAAWSRRLEATLWVLGALALGWVGWGWVDGRVYQARQERLLDQALLDGSLGPIAEPSTVPSDGSRGAADAPTGATPAGTGVEGTQGLDAGSAATGGEGEATDPGGHPGGPFSAARRSAAARSARAATVPALARLSVPRLDMSVMVAEGLDSRTLRRAAGHIPGTAPLGSAGNVGLAGHRDSFFRPLRHVRVGDELVLTTPQAVSRYVVEWTEVVTPQSTEVLRPTPYPALTLVTCYPFTYVGTAPDRLVVRARLVESRAPQARERVAGLAAALGG